MKTKISEFIRAASNLTDDNIGGFSNFIQSNKFKFPSHSNPDGCNDHGYDKFFTNFIVKHVNLSRVSEKNIHGFFRDNNHVDQRLYILKRMENGDDETIAFVSKRINRVGIGEILNKLEVGIRQVVYKKPGSKNGCLVMRNPGVYGYHMDRYGVVFCGEEATRTVKDIELGVLVFLNYVELYPERIDVRMVERFYNLFPNVPSSSFFIRTLLDKVDFSPLNIDFSDLDHYQKVSLMKMKLKINNNSAKTIFTLSRKDENYGFNSMYLRMKGVGITYEILKENGLFEEFIKSDFGNYCNKKIVEDVHNE